MKKLINFIIILAIILSPAIGCVNACGAYDSLMAEMNLRSECLLLQSRDNGTVIFEKNADKQTAPASLTKIVTATVVFENCDNLEQTVTVKDESIHMLDGTGSSMGGLKAGEIISLDNLLHYMLISSANEAAIVLADYVGGGDIDKFIGMMNELVLRLGCENTHFVNPHGLDDEDQYSTANDLAAITLNALKYEHFEEIVSKLSYTVPATNMNKEKKLLSTNFMMNSAYRDYYCAYAKGVKTGSTSGAGKCVISTAAKDGYSYIGIALGAPFEDVDNDRVNENCAFMDCKKMFNWAFDNLRLVSVSDVNKIIAEVPVKLSWTTDFITLSPKSESFELVPVGTGAGSLLIVPDEKSMPESLNAPIKKGETVCTAKVMYAGKAIAEIELVANSDVRRSIILTVASLIWRLMSTAVFRIIAVLVLLAFAALLFLRYKNKKKKRTAKNIITLDHRNFRGMR